MSGDRRRTAVRADSPKEARLRTRASFWPRLLAAGLSMLMVLAGLSCSSAAGQQGDATQGEQGSGAPAWKQVWTDSFNGPASTGVSTQHWTYSASHGTFGTNEVETTTTSTRNVHLDGHGNLNITALGHGGATQPGSAWTSGRIQTKSSGYAAPAGGEMMVTASIKQPSVPHGLGYWPGFWMLGPSRGWPATGEIDIMENVDGYSKVSGTLHCGNLTQQNPDGTFGPCHEKNGLGSGLQPCEGCLQSFHTYTVIIDRRHAGHEQIRWYLDGHEFYSVSESQVGAAAWTPAVDHGFSILLSVGMGGAFPDEQCRCSSPTSQTSSGGTMVVRYVSVYTN
jgi:beta-glucanase (GH16 family)